MALAEQLQAIQEQVENFDISDLSADNIGAWPLPVKIISWVIALTVIMVAGYKFIISDLQVQEQGAIKKEVDLKKSFETKAFQAANLEAYRAQMVDMEDSFGALISQLPSDTEVPGLLEDITNKGSSSGLVISKISLLGEKTHEFYMELPISMVATGTYHDMGAFVSGVAGLPRIVTLTGFTIKPKGSSRSNSELTMNITASTYRYRDLSKEGGKKGKKGKRK